MKKEYSRTVKGLAVVVLFTLGFFLFKRSTEVIPFVLEKGDILRCPFTGFNHGRVLWIGSGVTPVAALALIALGFILFRTVWAGLKR